MSILISKRAYVVIAVLFAFAAAVSIGVWIGRPAMPHSSTANVQEPTSATSPRILYYRNPMGLPDTSPEPKQDSMGMDYIPVYATEATDDGTIMLNPGKIQKTGVRSEAVQRRILNIPIHAPGTIQFDERRISIVSLRFEGFIDQVSDVTTGSVVKKGQPLMYVYGSALANASAEYLSALKIRFNAQKDMSGARRRLENLGMPEDAISALERAREVRLSIPWPSPQDGVVLERKAINGMRAAPGDAMFTIADVSVVWAEIDLSESDIATAILGQKVTIRPRGMPGHEVIGKISLIYPNINKETRKGRVRVELANPDGFLRQYMYVEAEIATGSETPVLSIPDNAIIDSGARQIVLLDKGEGRFEPRSVKIGRRGDGFTEIQEGLVDTDKVVVSSNFLIDAESNLKASLNSLDKGETIP